MLQYFTPQLLDDIISLRNGEVKLGSVVTLANETFSPSPAHKYAILGIPEDLGVQANMGLGGADTAWEAFMMSFLNVQANAFTPVDQIVLWGTITKQSSVDAYDTVVAEVVTAILSQGLIPIVIGGGHNNAYPLLKALATVEQSPINCINIDPHADLRVTQERHSGNGFSCAVRDQYLSQYAMTGLHQSYNNQFIIDQITDTTTYLPIWWEDIFLKGTYTWGQAIQQGVGFVGHKKFGVELDIDSIENALSSAMTPVGISSQQACQALFMLGMHPKAAYLHLPEAIARRSDGQQQPTIGKLLSYLVLAFMKGSLD